MFDLIINDTTIKLKWGTWPMKRLTDIRGITIDEFFKALQNLTSGESVQDNILKLLVDFLYCGYEYANGKPPAEFEPYEWIDACGGITKINEGQLVDYVNYVIQCTVNGATPLPGEKNAELEKKSS